MSETSSESPSRSADASLDEDRYWTLEKVLYFQNYLMHLYQWPLAEACILLLDETDLLKVKLLRLNYDAYELATGDFRMESITRLLGLQSTPATPDALSQAYSKAVEAIRKYGLPATKHVHANGSSLSYLVQPSKFLQWAVDEGYVIPDEILVESNAKFNWDGQGYSANQRLFIQRLVAQLILDPVEYLTEKSNRFKIEPLVDDIAESGQWPAGMQPPKNRRFWYELAKDVLAVYHERAQGHARR